MKKVIKIIITAIVCLLVFPLMRTSAAELTAGSALVLAEYHTPGSFYFDIVPEGELLKVVIRGYSGDTSINAVMAGITFSGSIFEIERIDAENSFCQLFIEDQVALENGASFICGTPSPGISGNFEVARIYFRIKNTGVANISFNDECLMLANDGLATDMLTEKINSELYIN
jgi:hypothetical protein